MSNMQEALQTTVKDFDVVVKNKKSGETVEESCFYNKIIKPPSPLLFPSYKHENGLLFTSDSIDLLKSIKDETIDLIFADPPYNIKKAEWDNFESQEEYIEWSLLWGIEASRILKPTGSFYICGFSEILADLKHPFSKHFKGGCKWIVWSYKNKANLGNDWGRAHESILHFRKAKSFKLNIDSVRIPYNEHTLKYPNHPQSETSQYSNQKARYNEWVPNPLGAKPKDVIEIPTTCNGMAEKTKHPTQKPEALLRKLILAASNTNDIVLDPFSGSGTTIVVAEQLGRKWIGCDMSEEYNEWAIKRIKNIEYKTVEEWIEFDRMTAKRRGKIR